MEHPVPCLPAGCGCFGWKLSICDKQAHCSHFNTWKTSLKKLEQNRPSNNFPFYTTKIPFDPLGLTTVTVRSDHYFACVLHSSVRANIHCQSECDLAEWIIDDSCFVLYCIHILKVKVARFSPVHIYQSINQYSIININFGRTWR